VYRDDKLTRPGTIPAEPDGARALALRVAAGVALLAALLVDERSRAARRAEVGANGLGGADVVPHDRQAELLLAFARHHRTTLALEVFEQRQRDGVRQRAHLLRPETDRAAPADPAELARDLARALLRRQRRGDRPRVADPPPDRLGHRHQVRPGAADGDEDLVESSLVRVQSQRDLALGGDELPGVPVE